MTLHCVVTKEVENLGLYAIYLKVNSCVNLVSYIANLNPKTFTIFETKKKAIEIVKEWNEDFIKNGLQKKA